jgi:hypothetical protein
VHVSAGISPPLLPATEEKQAHTQNGAGRCTASAGFLPLSVDARCKLPGHWTSPSHMDELTKLIKDLIRLLQTITEEDGETLGNMDLSELKEELGPWFIADYPLYQGA